MISSILTSLGNKNLLLYVCGARPQEGLAQYLWTVQCGIKDDPLLWWKKNIHTYPTLVHIAQDMLAIPGELVFVHLFTDTQIFFLPRWICTCQMHILWRP